MCPCQVSKQGRGSKATVQECVGGGAVQASVGIRLSSESDEVGRDDSLGCPRKGCIYCGWPASKQVSDLTASAF